MHGHKNVKYKRMLQVNEGKDRYEDTTFITVKSVLKIVKQNLLHFLAEVKMRLETAQIFKREVARDAISLKKESKVNVWLKGSIQEIVTKIRQDYRLYESWTNISYFKLAWKYRRNKLWRVFHIMVFSFRAFQSALLSKTSSIRL